MKTHNSEFNNNLKYKFLEQLKHLPFVQEIYLYGSRARGDNQSRSDIDLAILSPNASKNDWLLVTRIIHEADTLLKIDCVRLDDLKESDPLRINIEKDKKILYSKKV